MAKSYTHYVNSVRGLSVKGLSFKETSPIFHNDFTRNLVLKTEAYLGAASDLTKQELAEMSTYLRQDLHDLNEDYQHSVEDFKHSAWYQTWDKFAWGTLAAITDKTQVEWVEISDDIHHQGRYYVGDEVGFGVLQCVRCGYKKELYHPAKVLSCANCEGKEFAREGFEP